MIFDAVLWSRLERVKVLITAGATTKSLAPPVSVLAWICLHNMHVLSFVTGRNITKYLRLPLCTEPVHREFFFVVQCIQWPCGNWLVSKVYIQRFHSIFMVSTVSVSLCFGPFPPWAGPNVHFQLLFTFTSLNIIITLQILWLALVGPSSQCLTALCAPA